MNPLTDRQEEILVHCISRLATTGLFPSIREIRDNFGFTSTNAVADHLKAITKKGYLRKPLGENVARGYRPTSLCAKYGINTDAHGKLEDIKAYVDGFPENIEVMLNKLSTPKQGASIIIARLREVLRS